MQRRIALVLATLFPWFVAAEPDGFDQDALESFHKDYDQFVRKLLGMAKTGFEPGRPELSEFDTSLWLKVIKKAKKVFGGCE